ncbi:MAG: multiple resistance and pH regulation protein F (MrpF / PhaF) superfamily [Wolbachia endosymbiont of Alcedoecus sp.]|nr:multiple resistance and pH regulation protein F (MrpF / PhaF) superfamily [Wolbachia endosymbiont of Alcedoecus sp.]
MLYCIVSKLSDTYDKVIAFNNFSTQVVLLITAMSIVLSNFFLLDIALLYASISFLSTIALMRLMLL